jgi:hypothetical protein
MTCNCLKCDCAEKNVKYLIKARLQGLACIFEKVASGEIDYNQSGAFAAFTEPTKSICGVELGNTFNLYRETTGTSARSLFGDLTAEVPSDFLKSGGAELIADAFVAYPLCLQKFDGTPCLKCGSINSNVPEICATTSVIADLTNYAAFAENLKYVIDILDL